MGDRKKLLVADDDDKLHELFTEYFSGEFEVFHAHDGADALMLAVEHKPDLILLDIMMPLLDGRTVCKKIKANPEVKDIKVIMVSGKNEQHDRLVGFEVGADEYVEKPVSLDYLSRVIKKLLK